MNDVAFMACDCRGYRISGICFDKPGKVLGKGEKRCYR